MAGRTAGDIFGEALARGRSLPQVHALAVALNHEELRKLVDDRQQGGIMPAWVTCRMCKKLVPMGKEHWRKNAAYCSTCYRAMRPNGDDDEVKGKEEASTVLEPASVPGPVRSVPLAEHTQESGQAISAVPPAGSEEDAGGDSGTADCRRDETAQDSDGGAEPAAPPVRRRAKW